ncbi:hypothetical protein CC86DRAFT_300457 [Ophiobolus disseminans]|uniref:Zn(2)-C6 fungal-type domain-containing protein n=1 Tax=Ophiobolus disseminans TaxID=1469910 RepID=A0A6A6ZMS2_9PLEO|nr:hypothetical protein CC86DRAFT_300457 [Ophiobolus disseminans]
MTNSDRKRTIQCKTKVKTGCTTCRIRKVKCDENKPFCRRCVDTGRTCDGYESLFRSCTRHVINTAHASGVKPSNGVPLLQPSFPEIAPQDIELLGRYFSTKTMFDVELGCNEVAKETLRASLIDTSVHHAVAALRTLREEFETLGNFSVSVSQQPQPYDHGLQQYCIALRGLASNLSYPGSNRVKSALLCCQVFISIEQVRGNYATMAQHLIQGFRIMHEHCARPTLVAANKLVPVHCDQLPLLDVFIVKLFAAPCKFTETPATDDVSGTASSVCPILRHPQAGEPQDARTIAPNMRTELTRIATSTLEFLDNILRIESTAEATCLLPVKAKLLNRLEVWLGDLEIIQANIRPPHIELLSVSFMRLFHQVLEVVVLGALSSSPEIHSELQIANNRLHRIAQYVGEGAQAYNSSGATGRNRLNVGRA